MPLIAKLILIGCVIWFIATIISDRRKSGQSKSSESQSLETMIRELKQYSAQLKEKQETDRCAGSFRFHAGVLSDADKLFAYAVAKNGVVTYTATDNDNYSWTIGYYDCEPDQYGITYIYDPSDHRKCGKVTSDGAVFLMRTAIYERLSASGLNPKPPYPEEKLVATIFGNEDAETGELFGVVEGDSRAAAAAFVSLVNDRHVESKYCQFYREYARNCR